MRQPAVRLFAPEYNDATVEYREEGQYSPNFVVTPLGAMVNRLFVVGVLLEVSEVGNSEEPFVVGRVTDPSGTTFRVSAGSKRGEVAAKLRKLEPPQFVAVIGKSDLYNPEPSVYRLSIDPEVVHVVDDSARMRWILDTAKATKERMDCVVEARKMAEPSVDELVKLGFSRQNAQGAVIAVDNYSFVDIQRYASAVADALSYILPEYRSDTSLSVKTASPEPEEDEVKGRNENAEEVFMTVIRELGSEYPDGVPWDVIIEEAGKRGVSKMDVEESYVSLRDKGDIVEPSIGLLKPA